MTQLTDKVWAYSIPDEAIEVSLCQNKHSRRSIPYWHINWNYPKDHRYTSGGACFFYKMLGGKKQYPTNLKFLFTTKTATEEDARKVVESEELFINGISQGVLYCNYHCQHDVCEWYKHETDSLNSLLRSKGLDDKNNFAIIEKMK